MAFIVCILPLALLFNLHAVFAVDWFNHLWIIEYFGDYLKRHWLPPEVFMTNSVAGLPMPLFYGSQFYTFAGVLSAFLGSAVAFRIVALIVILLQFWHVERAACISGSGKWFSFTIAAVVTWSIYPLTNLYNRSALTEFVAVALLTASISSLFVLISRVVSGRKSGYDAVASGLLFCAAATTHPLTAIFGGLFLLILAIAALIGLRGHFLMHWFIRTCFMNALMMAAVLAPWFVVMVLFSGSIQISSAAALGWRCFPNSIDNFWARIAPIAIDFRMVKFEGQLDVAGPFLDTPYLDAQIALPLLVMLGLLFWILRKTRTIPNRPALRNILYVSIGMLLVCFILSLLPTLPLALGKVFYLLQFPYRLTSYINLASLMAVYACAGLIDWSIVDDSVKRDPVRAATLAACLVLSFCALMTKLVHAAAVMRTPTNAFCEQFNRLMNGMWNIPPATVPPSGLWTPSHLSGIHQITDLSWLFYGRGDYTVTKEFAKSVPAGFESTENAPFLPDPSDFGRVKPLMINLKKPTLVLTNVQPFPWNRLVVDAGTQKLEQVATTVVPSAPIQNPPVLVQALPLPAGLHTIEYKFQPSPLWRGLNLISWIALAAWITVWVRVSVLNWRNPKAFG